MLLSKLTGLICTDNDRFTGLGLQCSQITKRKKEDEINSGLALFDVIHQQQPGLL